MNSLGHWDVISLPINFSVNFSVKWIPSIQFQSFVLRSSISILLRSNNSIFMFMLLLLLLLSVKNNIKNLNHQILSSFINWWYSYFYYSMTSLLWWQFFYSVTIHLFKKIFILIQLFKMYSKYRFFQSIIHVSIAVINVFINITKVLYPKYCIQNIVYKVLNSLNLLMYPKYSIGSMIPLRVWISSQHNWLLR